MGSSNVVVLGILSLSISITVSDRKNWGHDLSDSSRRVLPREVLPPGAEPFQESDQQLWLPAASQSAGEREGGGGDQETISNQGPSRHRETPLREESAGD